MRAGHVGCQCGRAGPPASLSFVVSDKPVAMWKKPLEHAEPLANRLAPLLALLFFAIVVCQISRVNLDPKSDQITWAGILMLSGHFNGPIHTLAIGHGLVFVGPPDNSLLMFFGDGSWFRLRIWELALALLALITLSLCAWAGLSSLGVKCQECLANPASAVDGGIPLQSNSERRRNK